MNDKKLIDILSSQKECFTRNCNHKCSRCPLEREPKDIILAYNTVIDLILNQKKIKQEFFNSGTEYAKAEFSRIIEREKDHVDELHKNRRINDLAYVQILGLQKAIELIEEIPGR